jgi:hypothetical protein
MEESVYCLWLAYGRRDELVVWARANFIGPWHDDIHGAIYCTSEQDVVLAKLTFTQLIVKLIPNFYN